MGCLKGVDYEPFRQGRQEGMIAATACCLNVKCQSRSRRLDKYVFVPEVRRSASKIIGTSLVFQIWICTRVAEILEGTSKPGSAPGDRRGRGDPSAATVALAAAGTPKGPRA